MWHPAYSWQEATNSSLQKCCRNASPEQLLAMHTHLNKRCTIVQMWNKGMSARRIASEMKTSVTTVYRWVSRWSEEGSLMTRPRTGRPYKREGLLTLNGKLPPPLPQDLELALPIQQMNLNPLHRRSGSIDSTHDNKLSRSAGSKSSAHEPELPQWVPSSILHQHHSPSSQEELVITWIENMELFQEVNGYLLETAWTLLHKMQKDTPVAQEIWSTHPET